MLISVTKRKYSLWGRTSVISKLISPRKFFFCSHRICFSNETFIEPFGSCVWECTLRDEEKRGDNLILINKVRYFLVGGKGEESICPGRHEVPLRSFLHPPFRWVLERRGDGGEWGEMNTIHHNLLGDVLHNFPFFFVHLSEGKRSSEEDGYVNHKFWGTMTTASLRNIPLSVIRRKNRFSAPLMIGKVLSKEAVKYRPNQVKYNINYCNTNYSLSHKQMALLIKPINQRVRFSPKNGF